MTGDIWKITAVYNSQVTGREMKFFCYVHGADVGDAVTAFNQRPNNTGGRIIVVKVELIPHRIQRMVDEIIADLTAH